MIFFCKRHFNEIQQITFSECLAKRKNSVIYCLKHDVYMFNWKIMTPYFSNHGWMHISWMFRKWDSVEGEKKEITLKLYFWIKNVNYDWTRIICNAKQFDHILEISILTKIYISLFEIWNKYPFFLDTVFIVFNRNCNFINLP